MAICIPSLPYLLFQDAGVATYPSSHAFGVCARLLYLLQYTDVCVFTFLCTFRWFRPILSVKLKEENNSNSNDYNDNI